MKWLLGLSLFVAAPAWSAPVLDIRTYPAGELRVHEIDRTHGLKSVLLQNLAVVNRGDAPATVDRVEFELRSAKGTLQTQIAEAAELTRSAAAGKQLSDAGMLAALDFQFRPGALFGEGVMPAATPSLTGKQSLLLMYRAFVFKGGATTLRVTAHAHDEAGQPVTATADIAVTERIAKGYRFPLKGTWTIGAGASFHTAHRWNVAEEFALDIIRMGADGRTYRHAGTRLADYYAYRAPVYAARDGKVAAVVDDVPENLAMLRKAGESKDAYFKRIVENQGALIAAGTGKIPGSHVVIDHGDGEFSIYAHLVPGSATVRVGQPVKAGEVIGKLGHSGNSTEPHLHFQVCDGPDPLYCAGLPVAFDDVELALADTPRSIQSGDVVIAK